MSERRIIKGNKALAAELHVCAKTVWDWRRQGLLAPATLADFGRTIIYDLDKVLECLRHATVRAGRPKNQPKNL